MTEQELQKLGERLRSRIPLLGTYWRRKACEELIRDPSAEAIPLLVEALGIHDEVVSTAARTALKSLKNPDAVDALCDRAIRAPEGAEAKICVEAGYRPSDPETRCLFLFVTRQLEAYFQEDFEFQNLRLAYDRTDEVVRNLVMEVVRSGDRRCLGFFGTRKALSECSDSEIRLALDSALRHKDWPRLFAAFLELPMKWGFSLLDEFRKSGWEPKEPELQSVYRQALTDSAGAALPPKKSDAESPLFERWLARGRESQFAALSESDLLGRLNAVDPSDGVAIVGALAAKKAGNRPEARKAIQESHHWLVRLAGHVTGLITEESLVQDSSSSSRDGNFWVKELVNTVGLLEFWPRKATPAHLEELKAAPREVWTGKLGAVRKVFQLLITHRITSGTFEEMVVEAGEFAGEFERAD